MIEIDMSDPDLGLGDNALEMATQSQRDLWTRGINPDGLDPFEAKILADTLAEVDAMSESELTELQRLGEGAEDGQAALDEWIDGLDDTQFSSTMAEASLYGDSAPDFLEFSRSINDTLAAMTDHEHVRQAEDADDRARRSGPHHNRRTAEETMARALGRYSNGTYVYGQATSADLASTMFAEDDFTTTLTAAPGEVVSELRYQLFGEGQPLARTYRQPLPPVGRLGAALGLKG